MNEDHVWFGIFAIVALELLLGFSIILDVFYGVRF